MIQPAPGHHVEWVESEAVVLDPDGANLHYLNPPAAIFFALISEYGHEEARRRLQADFGISVSGDELDALVADMLSRGILVDA